MRKVLVLQHVPFEILGTLNPLLKRTGFRIRYVNFGRDPEATPDLGSYQGLVILGGPMSVNQHELYPHLQTEVDLIKSAIQLQIPILGICLGAQLIARALGARITRNPVKEIGWYEITPTTEGESDPVIAPFRGPRQIFQWHGDTFDLPSGAVHLASSPTCQNQAFRFGENVYGFQFHLEVDAPLIVNWLERPAYKEELLTLKGPDAPDRIRTETDHYIDNATSLGEEVFGAFVKQLGVVKKVRTIGSK